MPEAGLPVKPLEARCRLASVLQNWDCSQFGIIVKTAVRIIARRTLIAYIASLRGNRDQAAVKTSLDAWFAEVKQASWANSAAVKQSYATASIITNSRIVFNIKGNDHRLIVEVHYPKALLWIIWIGTHKAYDHIDAAGVKFDG